MEESRQTCCSTERSGNKKAVCEDENNNRSGSCYFVDCHSYCRNFIYSPNQTSKGSSDLPYGLRGGDYFIYDATGTYNNSIIAGIYNLTLVGNVSRGSGGGYSYLNSTIPELNRLMMPKQV